LVMFWSWILVVFNDSPYAGTLQGGL
jgi:hypothetical protein